MGEGRHLLREAPGPVEWPKVETLSREDFDRKVGHGYAGTVATLLMSTFETWPELYPDWKRQHWHMTAGASGGATLEPVNVDL